MREICDDCEKHRIQQKHKRHHMKLNVRKRNGVWAVACDDAVLRWFTEKLHGEFAWWAAIDDCQERVANPLMTEIELGLRNAY